MQPFFVFSQTIWYLRLLIYVLNDDSSIISVIFVEHLVMKTFLLFISVLFASLFCAGSADGALLSDERCEAGYGLQLNDFSVLSHEDTSAGFILPVAAEAPNGTLAFEDAHSLARQLRMFSRGQRQLVLHYTLVDKALLSKAVKNCIAALYLSSNHTYTSLPYPSWEVSSEHYIFGMHRILI